jgi:hypothetical protein
MSRIAAAMRLGFMRLEGCLADLAGLKYNQQQECGCDCANKKANLRVGFK